MRLIEINKRHMEEMVNNEIVFNVSFFYKFLMVRRQSTHKIIGLLEVINSELK
jgi:hypothetical protein